MTFVLERLPDPLRGLGFSTLAHAIRGMTRVAERFARYFANWDITLPDSNLTSRERGEIRQRGWHIQFLFDTDERGEYLDFYATHRMTNDRHHRIYEDGTVKHLEACEDFVVYPADATEEQEREATERFRNHNARVLADLKRKGFA